MKFEYELNNKINFFELIWLYDCISLAETLSFSRAAQIRNVTQPAFSRRIQALEEWIGTPLFIRSTRGVQLTKAGESFLNQSFHLLRDIETAKNNALEVAGCYFPEIILAATHSISSNFFPNWIRKNKDHSVLEAIHLVSDTFSSCKKMLQHGQANFLLSYSDAGIDEQINSTLFDSIIVGYDTLVPVCACNGNNPLWDFSSSSNSQLPLLSYSLHSGLGQILSKNSSISKTLSDMRVRFTSDLATTLLGMARAGDGIAWIPQSIVQDDINHNRLTIMSTELSIQLEIKLFRPLTPMSKSAEKLWSIFTEEKNNKDTFSNRDK